MKYILYCTTYIPSTTKSCAVYNKEPTRLDDVRGKYCAKHSGVYIIQTMITDVRAYNIIGRAGGRIAREIG